MKVFVSYAHPDTRHRDLLFQQLKRMQKSHPEIECSSDQDILYDKWRRQIAGMMKEAFFAILLLTPEYLESDHCMAEMRQMLRDRGLRVIAVLVKRCQYKKYPELSERQVLTVNDSSVEAQGVTGNRGWSAIRKQLERAFFAGSSRPVARGAERDRHRAGRTETGRPGEPRRGGSPDIETAIREGSFTPFVGPLCYNLPENYGKAVDHVSGRLACLQDQLADEIEREFARSVVEARMPGQRKTGNALSKSEMPKPSWLTKLQIALVKLGHHASTLFGAQMASEPKGVVNVGTFAIHFDAEGPDGMRLLDLLLEACRACEATDVRDRCLLSDSQSQKCTTGGCFRPSCVMGKLVALTWTIFKDHPGFLAAEKGTPIRDWRNDHQSLLDRIQRQNLGLMTAMAGNGGGCRLYLSQIEWICDLLWHTFRFDAAMYPPPEDLAFQLSLCAEDVLPKKARFSATVTAFPRASECLPRLFKYYSGLASEVSTDSRNRSVYEAIARALCQIDAAAAGEAGDKQVPLAFSTNLDMEIERVLEAKRRDHHVLFPILVKEKTAGGREVSSSGWLLMTESSYWKCSWHFVSEGTTAEDLAKVVRGPLIVKLRGSPLHLLPRSLEVGLLGKTKGGELRVSAPTTEYSHRALLSDYDVLESLLEGPRVPSCVRDLLAIRSHLLCFLGYPLGDPNGLFGLHQGVHLARGPEASAASPQVLVDYPRDKFRHAILSKLSIDLVEMPLNDFASLVDGIPDLRPL
jgi:hypothetical protein